MPEDNTVDFADVQEFDPRDSRGLKGRHLRWFRAQAFKRWARTAVFIRCICGREHRVCSSKTCRCGAGLSYRHEGGMTTPYATIQTDTIEEWIAQGHPVKRHEPEALCFDWKLVRPVNWSVALRRMGK